MPLLAGVRADALDNLGGLVYSPLVNLGGSELWLNRNKI
jgi:hypothetical protein